jgi:hypothetical protein
MAVRRPSCNRLRTLDAQLAIVKMAVAARDTVPRGLTGGYDAGMIMETIAHRPVVTARGEHG